LLAFHVGMRGFSPCTLCPKRFAWDPSFASVLWTLTWVHKYCVRAPSPRRSLDNRAAQLIPTGFPKPTSRYRFGLSKWFGGECAYRSRERSLDRSGFPEFSDRPGHLAFHSSETAPRIRGAPRFVGVGRATHLFGGRLLGLSYSDNEQRQSSAQFRIRPGPIREDEPPTRKNSWRATLSSLLFSRQSTVTSMTPRVRLFTRLVAEAKPPLSDASNSHQEPSLSFVLSIIRFLQQD
jgi:hypothetical protein